VLAVKGNQPALEAAVRDAVTAAFAAGFARLRHDAWESVEDGHRRHEERYVTVINDPPGLAGRVAGRGRRGGRRPGAAGRGQVLVGDRVLHHQPRRVGGRVRRAGPGPLGVENGRHWVPDVAFREDASRTRAGHAGENLGLLRRVAVSLLKRAPGRSIKGKRLKAGWDDEYLLQVLQGITAN
jgi:hypothetical protein